MARHYDTLPEAIAEADRMAALFPKNRYQVIQRLDGQFSAMTRNYKYPEDKLLYRTWSTRSDNPPLFTETPKNKAFVESMTRKALARFYKCSVHQIDYLLEKYDWTAKRTAVEIKIGELKAAMQTMTAAEYARQLGVHDARIYKLCRDHNIPRPVRGQPGGGKWGDKVSAVARRKQALKIEDMREFLQTHTIKEYAKKTGQTLPWLYQLCKDHNIERPVRRKVGRASH